MSSIDKKLEGPTTMEAVVTKQDQKLDTSAPTKESLKPKTESVSQSIQDQYGSQIRSETQATESIEQINAPTLESPHQATESEVSDEKITRTKSPSVIKSPQPEKVSLTEEKTYEEVRLHQF